VRTQLLPRLTGWPSVEIPDRPSKITFAEGPKEVKIDRSITQANIILGHAGVARSNPDYYALTVMNYVLGSGGFASRLVEEIETGRLAYSVTSFSTRAKIRSSQVVLRRRIQRHRRPSLSLREMGH
jgi:zinc protease